jgi:hypothetical protein
MDKKTELEIAGVEYQIRKTERGIKVLFAQKGKPDEILRLGEKREKLKGELEQLTRTTHFSSGQWKVLGEGRREPEAPEWPL